MPNRWRYCHEQRWGLSNEVARTEIHTEIGLHSRDNHASVYSTVEHALEQQGRVGVDLAGQIEGLNHSSDSPCAWSIYGMYATAKFKGFNLKAGLVYTSCDM